MSAAQQDEQVAEAARQLARARWGNSVVRGAVTTLQTRRGELDAEMRAELRHLGSEDQDGDDAA